MQTPPPSQMKPGARSVTGSGISPDAMSKQRQTLGTMTQTGLNSYPAGASEVSYDSGATTPATAAFQTGDVKIVPMK